MPYFEPDLFIEKVPNSVNLLGMSYDDYNWRADIKELKRILRLLGIKVISSLSIADSIEEIKRAPSAQINVILSDEIGFRIGEIMERRFGIPYICYEQPLPYGVENTNEWVMRIAAALGKEEIAKKIVAKESKLSYKKLVWKTPRKNSKSN